MAIFQVGRTGETNLIHNSPLDAARQIITDFSHNGGPRIVESRVPYGTLAFYDQSEDMVHVRDARTFPNAAAYLRAILHELGHSTGHRSRIGRQINNPDWTPAYGREELVAEMTAAILADEAGIKSMRSEHREYLEHYIEQFNFGERVLRWAEAQAGRAANFILGRSIDDLARAA